MEYSAKTDVGNIKFNNEDSFLTLVNKNIGVFAVADGMGGHDFGEEASLIAITYIKEQTTDKLEQVDLVQFMTNLFENINSEIHKTGIEKNTKVGMGTTLTMAVIINNNVVIGHVGDSRLYIINQEISQVTKDHSYVEQLIDKGMITKKEAKSHPKKNIITRALGTMENVTVDVIVQKIEKDDVVLLCSDGLSNLVEDQEIKDIVINSADLDTANEQLLKLAKNRGGYDNATVVTIKNC